MPNISTMIANLVEGRPIDTDVATDVVVENLNRRMGRLEVAVVNLALRVEGIRDDLTELKGSR